MADTGARRSGGGGDELCWCLRRLGGSQDRLLLQEGEEVYVGRGLGVTYQLVSTMSPLMISRTHGIFRQNAEGQWTVTDNNSLNGVWLEKEKLDPQKAYVLTKGICVQLGVALPNSDKAEFEYELVQENLEQIRPFLIRPLTGKSRQPRTKRKLNCEDSEASGTEGTSNMSKAKVHRFVRDGEGPAKSYKTDLSKQPTMKALVEELECSMEGDVIAATQQQCHSTLQLSRMRQSIAELRSLNSQVQEKQLDMRDKLKTPQQSGSKGSKHLLSAQQELHDLQKELSSKREEHLHRVNELKKIFHEEQEHKCESKLAEEEGLKEPLAQALQEHSLLMEELNRSHRDFELIIQAKNKELQETKEEKEKMEAQREEVLNHMSNVLDNELQCIICSEHFIEAVTLNCAHSFCSFCIQSWRKRKEECPICRQGIRSQTRSLVLDNCINSMVDKLSPDMKDRRLALILERKAEQQAVEVIAFPTDSDSSSLPSDTSLITSSEDSDELDDITEDSSGSEDPLYLESDDDDDIFFIM